MGTSLHDWAESALGHGFSDDALLAAALTHGGGRGRNYERLEFLGDRVLGFVIAAWLFEAFDESEGELARRFAALVDKATCADVARAIGVPDVARIDPAARQTGAAQSDNILGDMCEALIGALYVDGGATIAERFVRKAWADHVSRRHQPPKDPKSALQEWAQGKRLPIPLYEVVGRAGPDHAPRFRVRVSVRGFDPVEAEGASKQDAEKLAATELLSRETPQ